MRKSKVLAGLISILTFLLGILLTVVLLQIRNTVQVMSLVEKLILITTFVVTFVSFIFSMITYFSIDSVGSVTAMDGNVLENENYVAAYEEMIYTFKDVKDQKAFTDKLFEIVQCPRRTKSCMVFADYLQKILDYIILFAYIDMSDINVKRRCDSLVETIRNEARRYNRLSNGIRYQLDENIKLISYILDYQQIRSKNLQRRFSRMENVRGHMLKNPISKILYYDYLGLDYRRKAAMLLATARLTNSDEFSNENMRAIMTYDYSEEEKNHVICLLERADMCYRKVQKYSQESILWEGYLSYNKVRVEVMKYLIKIGKNKKKILKELDQTINVRKNIEYLFKYEDSYLSSKFEEEVRMATYLKKEFELL